jgi:putative endonuclease
MAASSEKKKTGDRGEELARLYLRKKGYRILATNYRFHHWEIDIVARDKDTVVFVEVKTRTTQDFGRPEDSVTSLKQKRIISASVKFLTENNLWGACCVRFDVISVSGNDEVCHIPGAFEE